MIYPSNLIKGMFRNRKLSLILQPEYLKTRSSFKGHFVIGLHKLEHEFLPCIRDLSESAIICILPSHILDFYLQNYHTIFTFAFDKSRYRTRERWENVYDTSDLFTTNDNLVSRTIKIWSHLKGYD